MPFNTKTGKYDPDFPFRSDGCSLFPDGDWKECCVEHDRAYWKGGDLELKREADRQLALCVRHKSKLLARPLIAALMWFGVSWGGFIPSSRFRWGYRYKWPRYGPEPSQVWGIGQWVDLRKEHPESHDKKTSDTSKEDGV